MSDITQEHIVDARNRGFVNHCVEQGMSAESTQELVDTVYTPLATQREESLAGIHQAIVGEPQ